MKNLRNYLGLTQQELARLLGISRSLVTMMEGKRRSPKDLSDVFLIQIDRVCHEIESTIKYEPVKIKTKELKSLEFTVMRRSYNLQTRIEKLQEKRLQSQRRKMFCSRFKEEHSVVERGLMPLLIQIENQADTQIMEIEAELDPLLFEQMVMDKFQEVLTYHKQGN